MTINRRIDLPGRIILTWFSAGSLLSGGWLVTYGLFNELIAHYYLLLTIAGLYLVGGFLSVLFGGAVGMFGRPIGMKIKSAIRDQLKGMLYTIPLAGVGFVVAGWIGLTYWSVYTMNVVALAFVTISWLISAIIIALAVEYGWFGLNNIFKRMGTLKNIRFKIEFKGE